MRIGQRRILLAGLGLLALAGTWFVISSWRQATYLRDMALSMGHGGKLSPRQLPNRWLRWLLMVEDPTFFTHHGLDFSTPGAGWTTLTQALVKLHFPGPSSGPVGKPLQSLRAGILDAAVPKSAQLTLFLNTAYFGDGPSGPLYGFSAAAHTYYGRPLSELTDRDYLGLVAMLVGPNRFNPLRQPHDHAERVRRISSLLQKRCRPLDWQDVYLSDCVQPGAPWRTSQSKEH